MSKNKVTDQAKQDQTTDPTTTDTVTKPEASPEVVADAVPDGEPRPAEAPKADDSPPPPKVPPAKRKKSSSGGGWFTGLLLVVLLAGLVAFGYYGWQREQALQAQVTQLDEALSGQRSQLSSLQRQTQTAVAEAEAKVEQSRQQISRMQEQLQSRLEEQANRQNAQIQTLHQQVRSLSTTTTEDWKLAEAYYLTRLASQRLLTERDTGSALALLQAADEIAKNYPDPDLHAVRSALADDIATLRLANNVDVSGIYLRIAALGRQAQALPVGEAPVFEPGDPAAEPENDAAGEEDSGIWATIRRSFQRALGNLQSYVRITRDDESLDSLMTGPAAAEQLLSSLQLNLDTAQLALLREQPEIYQHSLDRAQQIATRLFSNRQQREGFLGELEALRSTDIVQQLPSISASQQAFANYLEQRHRLAPSGNGAQQQGDQR